MSTISKFSIYCIEEEKWVYSWGTDSPTKCSNNTTHLVNLNSVQIIEIVSSQNVEISNTYQDTLQSLRVVQQTPVIQLKSFHGITKQNQVTTVGTATATAISEVDSEIKLNITGATDEISLRSKERGYYNAGLVSECGIALRIPQILDTTQELKFGYFDDNNGYYFKIIGNSLNLGIMYNGVETLIERNAFNKNKLDGTTEGLLLDLTKGNIFRINFTWYGFGDINFGVVKKAGNDQKIVSMHSFSTSGQTSCGNPNLPINIKLSSNGSTQDTSVYIAGRQYSILGKVIDNTYKNMYNISDSVTLNTSTRYLFSLKHKTNYKTCLSQIIRLRASSSSNAIIKILRNASLTGHSFIDNPYVEESCLSVDTSASFTGGVVCKTYLVFGNSYLDLEIKDMNIYEDDIISIVWNSITGTSSIGMQIDYQEKW